jgi:hypothetical protein
MDLPTGLVMGEFPQEVREIIEEHHRGGIGNHDCMRCSSWCCSHSGFGILDNVKLIYKAYQAGLLKRDDYSFAQGLSFEEFVSTYFDVAVYESGKESLAMYFPKCLNEDGEPITIPIYSSKYVDVRGRLFRENGWLSRGCVFLNKMTSRWPDDDKNLTRKCLLHTDQSQTHLSMKPVDCVFHTCEHLMEPKEMSRELRDRWFKALMRIMKKW